MIDPKGNLTRKTILVTGSPGFIGANLVLRLLRELSGGHIISLDNMNDYYDVALKEYRLSQIEQTAQLRAGQQAAVNSLVNELRSCPIPAQPVYGSQPIFTCGGNNCGVNCGCGVG